MEVFELTLEDLMSHGVFKISLVGRPAMEENFIKLSEQLTLAKVDSDKRLIVGPAMIPNKQILRIAPDGKEYKIFFTPETIEAAAHQYLIQSKQHEANIEHEIDVKGVITVESWIVEDPESDKSKALGFNVPKGTWMLAMKVQDDRIWTDLIKSDLLRGFSIEGSFLPNESNEELDALLKEVEVLLNRI
jgi:hypothetical protein